MEHKDTLKEDPFFEVLEVKCDALADNEECAEAVRALLGASGVYFINLMGSPGAGKTTFLEGLFRELDPTLRVGVLEADADGETDAERIAKTGKTALQIHTGGSCHMDAEMTGKGLLRLPLDDLDLVILENVGNLVCPAEFDTGADMKLVLLSVPEGDDKPLKYPLMFEVADLICVTKTDVEPVFDFDREAFVSRVKELNPFAEMRFVSSLTGEGMAEIARRIEEEIREKPAYENLF